jgi:hypothetical protein
MGGEFDDAGPEQRALVAQSPGVHPAPARGRSPGEAALAGQGRGGPPAGPRLSSRDYQPSARCFTDALPPTRPDAGFCGGGKSASPALSQRSVGAHHLGPA